MTIYQEKTDYYYKHAVAFCATHALNQKAVFIFYYYAYHFYKYIILESLESAGVQISDDCSLLELLNTFSNRLSANECEVLLNIANTVSIGLANPRLIIVEDIEIIKIILQDMHLRVGAKNLTDVDPRRDRMLLAGVMHNGSFRYTGVGLNNERFVI